MATYNANTSFTTMPNTALSPFSYQAVGAGLDASDGVLSIEYSNDKTNWSQVPDLVETVLAGASDTHFNVNVVNHIYYRLRWAAGANTAGTITVIASA